MAKYCWRFVKEFSRIAKPLSPLTQANKVWMDRWLQVFKHWKKCLMSASLLRVVSGIWDFTIYGDASCKWLGCVLMQNEKT